jgi:hypothetical protein
MTSKPARIPDHLQAWITARKRHHLSHAHVQMARELGMKPKTLGKIDNADQEPWKLPLPAFIESLYHKRFGKDRPDIEFHSSIATSAYRTRACTRAAILFHALRASRLRVLWSQWRSLGQRL